MDFLLECLGFPPSTDLAALAAHVRRAGDLVPLRGPEGEHRRLTLPGGLEVRLDREQGAEHDSLWPWFESSRRLRVALESLVDVPDSPFDVLLHGRANPPLPDDPWREANGDEYALTTWLWDARRLPSSLPRGHVLALSLAGFALDVGYVGPDEGVQDPELAEEPTGASLMPLAGADTPGGCMQLSLVVRTIQHLENPLSHETIERLEVEAPGRPLDLFLSRWQLESHGLPAPRPGWRVEGTFLFHGRITGGLPVRGRRR